MLEIDLGGFTFGGRPCDNDFNLTGFFLLAILKLESHIGVLIVGPEKYREDVCKFIYF